MKILVTGAVLASAAVLPCQAQPKPKPPALENSRWHVTASPVPAKDQKDAVDGDTKFVDALLFRSGTVASNVQGRRGLKAAAFTLTPKEGRWQMAARQASPKVGDVTWSCEIAGNKISGTMVFKHKSGKTERFRLSGRRAPELETTTWNIRVTDKSGAVDDTILFAGHKMTSKAVRAKGFVMCAYNLVPEEGGWVLEAVQRSKNKKDKSRLVWSAQLAGNKIKGTITMFDADGETQGETTFEGVKSKKRVRVKQRAKSKKSKKGNKKK